MTARTDTARLLALIPYLRSHPGVAVTEVAECLVSALTV
ncbi:DNA-binding protein [Cutibacterium acnes JCM 18916]|nr:DNA-binding protein [Cutibacterium acnes JCM 18916]